MERENLCKWYNATSGVKWAYDLGLIDKNGWRISAVYCLYFLLYGIMCYHFSEGGNWYLEGYLRKY